ncbi:MAG: hypothetical protein WAM12_06050 [Pseudolabrys sp.]
MPDPLHEGGLTMALYRNKSDLEIAFEQKELGIEKPAPKQRVADFSYTSDALAQMIVDAWTDETFETRLLDKSQAKDVLAERGIYLSKPHVITEQAYYDGHHCDDPDEVVFVLPNKPRVVRPPPGRSLLETAKLLMAITPNGI